jgi:glutathione S-transferase
MLHYKDVNFEEMTPSAVGLYVTVRPAVGRAIMPTLQMADGTWRQDSALICDELEATFRSRPTTPPGPTQRLASLLLELLADEWFPMLALHYRWNTPGNKEWATREFGRCAFPWMPPPIANCLAAPFANKMQSFRAVQGIAAETHAGIERLASNVISVLDAHLASHRFLLGGVPCRADFALYGPLWAHLFRDPQSRHLFESAPNVRRWLESLHGHRTDPAFPTLPTAQPQYDADACFLPADLVPATLDPLFRIQFAEQWPYLVVLSRAVDSHVDAKLAPADSAPVHVPRSLGHAGFNVGGAPGTRTLLTYTAWRLQRPLDEYAKFTSLECVTVNEWLDRLGARRAFCGLQPKFRLERPVTLPMPKESLTAVPHVRPGAPPRARL